MPFETINNTEVYSPRDLPLITIDELDIDKNECQGSGSFGTVYKARWKSRGTIVAVKMFTDERNVDSWSSEVKELLRVSHSNIIKLYGASLHHKPPYLVTEFAESGSLASLLKNKKKDYDLNHACSWARQTANGVAYLHTLTPKPITHRDLKPANLLLCKKFSKIKICDFGTACTVKTQATCSVTGSASYMAPEVIRGLNYREKCDVYSWAVTFWEILARRRPYEFAANDYVIMWSVTEKKRRPEALLDCPNIISELLEQSWDEDINRRPSMLEVLKQMNLIWIILNDDNCSKMSATSGGQSDQDKSQQDDMLFQRHLKTFDEKMRRLRIRHALLETRRKDLLDLQKKNECQAEPYEEFKRLKEEFKFKDEELRRI